MEKCKYGHNNCTKVITNYNEYGTALCSYCFYQWNFNNGNTTDLNKIIKNKTMKILLNLGDENFLQLNKFLNTLSIYEKYEIIAKLASYYKN